MGWLSNSPDRLCWLPMPGTSIVPVAGRQVPADIQKV